MSAMYSVYCTRWEKYTVYIKQGVINPQCISNSHKTDSVIATKGEGQIRNKMQITLSQNIAIQRSGMEFIKEWSAVK